MLFHWSLSDSKSPQVSCTLLSFLNVLNNAVVLMVSTRPTTSKSSSPFSNPLTTVRNAPMTIGIIVICMFHSFFQFPCKVDLLILLFSFFQFYSVVCRDRKVDYFASSLLYLFNLLFWKFFSPGLGDVIPLEFERQQISWTLHNILTDLNNALIWIFSTRPLISKSSSPGTNPLVTVPDTPITIGITVTFMIQNIFISLPRSSYLPLFSLSFNFMLPSA